MVNKIIVNEYDDSYQVAFKSKSRRRRGIDVEEYDEEPTKIYK
jgi:hypothetical protein